MENENKEVAATSQVSIQNEKEDYLKKLYENSEKELKLKKITTFSLVGIFVVIQISALVLVPSAKRTINEIHSVAQKAGDTVEKANGTIDDISGMATKLQESADNMNGFINDNSETVTDSLKKISEIDFEGLNKGIKDLQDAVGPMASFMSRFK